MNTLPERLLLGPGPSNAHPDVLAAMSQPLVGHLDPAVLDLVDEVRGQKPLAPPGEDYVYADANYVLLALVIQAVTGDHVAALHDEIIEPLNLGATSVYVRGEPEPGCVCNTYWEVGGDRLENVSDYSAEYAIHDIGADGIAASPLDALTFVEALVRGDLLSEASFAERTLGDLQILFTRPKNRAL